MSDGRESSPSLRMLLATYEPRLRNLIRLRVGAGLRRIMDVDDVYQEVVLAACRSFPRFEWRGPTSFWPWLACIAERRIRNLAREQRAKKRAHPGGPQPAPLPEEQYLDQGGSADVTGSRLLRRRERMSRLEQALGTLSEDHRRVILLARIERLPIKEVAGRMNRTRDATSMLLLRALRRLRVVFGETESLRLPEDKLRSVYLPKQPRS